MSIYTVAYGGERLDRIAKATMGSERGGTVEAILEENPGLSSILVDGTAPGGTEIRIPEDFEAAASTTYTLAWE